MDETKTTKPRNSLGGRKEITIDWKLVEDFLTAGANGAQTAAYIGVSDETLYERVKKKFGINFADYSAKFKSRGDAMLHVAQFKKAMKQDNTMMMWLGKNRLGQKDTPFELGVNNETVKQFTNVLSQLQALRSEASVSALNKEDTNISDEIQS